jgi:hypothetical protein
VAKLLLGTAHGTPKTNPVVAATFVLSSVLRYYLSPCSVVKRNVGVEHTFELADGPQSGRSAHAQNSLKFQVLCYGC